MASSSLRKAGSLFGIDLGGLFGTDGEEGGFNLSPFMQFSNTSKGRGGVLNFRPQPQTGTTTSFGFMPQSPGIQNINVVGSNIGQQSNDFLGRYLSLNQQLLHLGEVRLHRLALLIFHNRLLRPVNLQIMIFLRRVVQVLG